MADDILREVRHSNLPSLRRPQLQRYCSRLGVPATGNKPMLIARLQSLLPSSSSAVSTNVSSTPTYTSPAGLSTVIAPNITTSGSVTTTPSLLPPTLATVTPSVISSTMTSTWLQTVAAQAAQAAVQQAMALVPQQQAQPLPWTPPTIPAPMIASQTLTTPITIPPPRLQQVTTATELPATSGVVSLLPPSFTGPALQAPSASITGYNLPGELPGMLSHSTIQKILSLQFIDLTTLLPGNQSLNDPQPIQLQVGGDNSQQLLLSRRPPVRKQITSITDWFIAFSAYAAVLTTADQSRGPDLFEYMRIIALAQQEHSGNAWQRYDIAFRKKAANKRFTKWSEIDPTLWNRAFSGQSRPSAFCSICMEASHTATACPLYLPGPAPTHSAAHTGPTQSGRKPICINFNRGVCKRNPCPRRHKCLTVGCEGEHPYTECPKLRSSPRKSK